MNKQNQSSTKPLILARHVRLFLTGVSMGTADLIPGVSGGTLAFIAGIYEELLFSIKTITGKTLRLALGGQFKEALASIPFSFFTPLFAGIFLAIFSLANLLSYLLNNYPVFLWSLFFGLILASIFVVQQRVLHWDIRKLLIAAVAAVATYFLVGAVPIETPSGIVPLFLSGAIAICAMILPGISGSFLLLIMGKYEQVLELIVTRDFLMLSVFALGCIVGIAIFSRILSWLFATHHDLAIAVLTGIMLGSLRKIWPWREVVVTRINSHGEIVPLVERNILPTYDASFVGALAFLCLGILLVYLLERSNAVKEHTDDIDDPEFRAETSYHEKV